MTEGFSPALLRRIGLVPDAAIGWRIDLPERCNLAKDLVGRWVADGESDRAAVIFLDEDGRSQRWSFGDLERQSNQLARAFKRAGLGRGEVVAVHSGSRPETIVAHLAAYKLGAVVATLSQLYGPDTLAHILEDSGARLLVTQDSLWSQHGDGLRAAGRLDQVFVIGEAGGRDLPFWDTLAREDESGIEVADTAADDPALLVYTSGSTGRPKGILHAHRLWRAYRPSLDLFYDLTLEQPGAVFWTPADWAWIGGLVDVVYPSLAFGHRVVACQRRFENDWALDLMSEHGVTHSLMTPTALRRLAQTEAPHRGRHLALRWIFTGGEALTGETFSWLQNVLGVVCNEGYGMSEVNHMIGNCQALRPAQPGSMGWEFPGHRALLVDDDGQPVPDGEPGEIVTSPDDPTLFLGYWKNPELTASFRLGSWVRTYDLAVRDEEGYYWYRGRKDDLIKSAGYRIGPAEIEDLLVQHPSVAEAAVIGKADPDRGQIVKALIRLSAGATADPSLVGELQSYVRERLAAYKYPREIEFIEEMPTTSTGKISRAALRKREEASSAA